MLVYAAAAAGAQPQPSAQRPPNLVLIVADDLGWSDVCAYGCARGRTPNLDRLAASGARFTAAYVTAPVCSPSRAALLTGRYQQRFGHEFSVAASAGANRAALGTPLTERMLPQYLAARGYSTGMVGKWHLGAQPQFQPTARGFGEFFGFLHSAHLYLDPETPGVHYVDRGPRRGAPLARDPQNPVLRGATAVEEPDYLTDAFTHEAVSFIERHRAEPFFLYVAYNAPHAPLQVTESYWHRFPEIGDEGERIYAGMVSALDDGVGAIVGALERAGLRDDTMVVFTSDNGCATYTEACSNEPLLAGKLTFLEGGVRVPFLVSWPAMLPSGRVIDAPVSTLDILPTALELAGAAAPSDRRLDGESLLPLLRAAATRLARERLFWRSGSSWAIRDGTWKLVQYPERSPFLFDLAADTGERHDLAAAMPDRVAALTAAYREWDAQMIAPLWPVRVVFYAVLAEILDRKPVRLLEAPEPGTIAVEF